jgi:hypothetical protein
LCGRTFQHGEVRSAKTRRRYCSRVCQDAWARARQLKQRPAGNERLNGTRECFFGRRAPPSQHSPFLVCANCTQGRFARNLGRPRLAIVEGIAHRGVEARVQFVIGHPLVAILATAMRASPIRVALLWRAPVLGRPQPASFKPSSTRERRGILTLPKRRSLVRQFVTGDIGGFPRVDSGPRFSKRIR